MNKKTLKFYYLLIIILICMPINGYLISKGSVILGTVLIIMQMPFIIREVLKIYDLNDKDVF